MTFLIQTREAGSAVATAPTLSALRAFLRRAGLTLTWYRRV